MENPFGESTPRAASRFRSGRHAGPRNWRGVSSCAAVWVAAAATVHAAPIHLEALYTLAASGRAPRQVHAGDLNGDDRTDLVVALRSGIAVLLARGGGHFEPPRITPLDVVLDAALGDVDRDGRLDAVVTLADNRLVVLHGNGDGSWRLDHTLPTRVTPRSIHLVDLDADAALDLVVACFGERVLSVYRGHGDGSFEPRLDRVLDGFPTAITSGDFDSDGRVDLAVTQRGRAAIWVLLRDTSLFGGRVVVPQFGCDPEILICVDLDADGDSDLLGAEPETGAVGWLQGGGDGSFESHSIASSLPPPITLAVDDLEADGIPDLVLGSGREPRLTVGQGDGRGGFRFSDRRVFLDPVAALALVDLTQDGNADLVGVHREIDRVAVAAGNHAGGFGWRFELPVDADPRDVLAADLDSDGDIDLCSSSGLTTSLRLYQSEGDGIFEPRTIPLGTPGGALLGADFDADGSIDLAVASGESRVVTLKRFADGWVPHMSIPVGLQPAGLTSGDLDDDRIVDLAVTCTGVDRIHVLGGDGTLAFSNLSRPSIVVGPRPAGLAVGELNADGKLDVVTANRGSNNVSILLGRGAGTFRPKLDLETGSQPRAVAIGDLNGDHRDDLAVANWGSLSLTLIFNDIAGLFQNRRYLATPSSPLAVRIADLDADGRNDLVATCNQGVVVFRAIAGGFFFAPETYLSSLSTTAIATGDVTGEGWLDLLVAGQDGTLGVLANDGTGRFELATVLPVGSSPSAVAAVELNGDAKTDVVVANSGSNDVSIYYGTGDGGFGAELRVPVGNAPRDILPLDVDHDGKIDLVIPNSGSRYASLLHNRGDGFEPSLGAPTDLQAAGGAVADLDADGQVDLILSHEFQDGYVIILRGQSDGSFEWPGDRPTGAAPRGLASVDLNHDGRLDLLSADSGSGTVTVQLADGGGWFLPSRRWPAGPSPSGLAVGDLDRDGEMDVAVAVTDTDAVAILHGRGDGGFDAPHFVACGDAPVALVITDLDADGGLDLAVANSGANSVSIFAGLGDGSFAPGIEYGTGWTPQQLVAADLDGDGRTDLAVQNTGNQTLALLFNHRAIVAVEITNVAITVASGAVHLAWELATAGAARSLWVERATHQSGPWETCHRVGLEPRRDMAFEDPLPVGGGERWYRIRLQRADGTAVVTAPLRAKLAASGESARLDPLGVATGAAPTEIRYRVTRASNVRLEVFDVRGRRVRSWPAGRIAAGSYATAWDRTDDRGSSLPHGLFFVRLTVDGRTLVRKLTVIGG